MRADNVWHDMTKLEDLQKKVDRRIDTGSVVATPENMDEPMVKNLLEPDFKKWLNK